MQWLAAYQLVRERNNIPVVFCLDEFCNAPLHGLPGILTLLRSYGIKCILETQDLDDISRVYGKHALESVLSETAIKQFLGGIRSQTTLDYLSKHLGNYTANAPSFTFDEAGVKESLGRSGRPLMTPDELRRLPTDRQIILYDSLKPILARKVPIFAVKPWRKQIGINSMYGKKRYLLPVMVKVTRRRADVTGRGEFHPFKRRLFGPAFGYVIRRLVPSPGFVVLTALAGAIFLEGFPHLRVEYAYSGTRSDPVAMHWCRYFGPNSFVRYGGDCPVIVFRKDW